MTQTYLFTPRPASTSAHEGVSVSAQVQAVEERTNTVLERGAGYRCGCGKFSEWIGEAFEHARKCMGRPR